MGGSSAKRALFRLVKKGREVVRFYLTWGIYAKFGKIMAGCLQLILSVTLPLKKFGVNAEALDSSPNK